MRRTFMVSIGIAVLVCTTAWHAHATGRYSATEPTSHPKTKGVPPTTGSTAPTIAMTDTAGQTFSLSNLRGRVVVLEWTNYECPYVSRHYASGNMQAVQRQAIASGATWITIFSSAPGKQGYLDARGADYFTAQKNASPSRKVLDPSGVVGRSFGARTTPHLLSTRAAPSSTQVLSTTSLALWFPKAHPLAITCLKHSPPMHAVKRPPCARQRPMGVRLNIEGLLGSRLSESQSNGP
jgi:AhpC/TSA family